MEWKRKANITLETRQGEEVVASSYTGDWYKKGHADYVSYLEPSGDGGPAPIRALAKWNGEELKITRRGGTESEHLFAAGRRCRGHYSSAQTQFALETVTQQLVARERQREGRPELTLEWSYELWVEDYMAGLLELRLHIQEAIET